MADRRKYGHCTSNVTAAKICFVVVISSLLLTSGTGCTAFSGLGNSWDYNDCCNEFVIGYRNRAWSARAWQERKKCHKGQKHLRHFGIGFRQGYEDVASGKDGCTPAFPPREYWGWKYQSPEGQAEVAAWFAGYPLGCQAAEEDGLGYYSEIQTSSQVDFAYEQHGTIPSTPIPQSQPGNVLPGMDHLLSEGESIIGKIEVSTPTNGGVVDPQAGFPSKEIGSGTRRSGDVNTPTHIAMPPPAPFLKTR